MKQWGLLGFLAKETDQDLRGRSDHQHAEAAQLDEGAGGGFAGKRRTRQCQEGEQEKR